MSPAHGIAAPPEAAPLLSSPVGSTVTVAEVLGDDATAFALLDIGVRPGARVRVMRKAPFGCPLEIALDGARFAVRCESARRIHVRPS